MGLDLFQQLKAKSFISQKMKHSLNYRNGAVMMLLVLSSETSQQNTKFPSLKPLPARSDHFSPSQEGGKGTLYLHSRVVTGSVPLFCSAGSH